MIYHLITIVANTYLIVILYSYNTLIYLDSFEIVYDF